MNLTRRQVTLMAASALCAPAVWSQAWPSRPIRLVTGGAGGVTDIRARWLGDRLAAAIGQPVVVENNAAGAGNVGAQQVARAAPDGHTLLLIHQGTAAVNPHLFAQAGYNPLIDFAPITRFGHGPLLLCVPFPAEP
jgi:tripartite-type tricarboxylate transporter receptor subunit TctC